MGFRYLFVSMTGTRKEIERMNQGLHNHPAIVAIFYISSKCRISGAQVSIGVAQNNLPW